jgi:hypothetical protein
MDKDVPVKLDLQKLGLNVNKHAKMMNLLMTMGFVIHVQLIK